MKKIAFVFFLIANLTFGQEKISIESYQSVPLIKLSLNDRDVYFIVDTGSSISVLDITKSKKLSFKFHNEMNTKSVGLGGEFSLYYISGYEVKINDQQIFGKFVGKDLSEITSLLQNKTNLMVVGIIGMDILTYYDVSISFLDKSMTFNLQ